MLEFCLQEQCALDAAGRLKLSASAWRDFQRHTQDEVILFCLPEGGIGIYPPDLWTSKVNPPAPAPTVSPLDSMAERRRLRLLGSRTQSAQISNQGRVTLPPLFREAAGLVCGEAVLLIGCAHGVEVWHPQRWAAELDILQKHVQDKGAQQMHADLGGTTP